MVSSAMSSPFFDIRVLVSAGSQRGTMWTYDTDLLASMSDNSTHSQALAANRLQIFHSTNSGGSVEQINKRLTQV